MIPELTTLVGMYRKARLDKGKAAEKNREHMTEASKQQAAEQKADALLKHLEPLMHSMEGGSEAMNEVVQEIAEEHLGKARKDKPAPTGPTVPMASLAEGPARPAPGRVTPAKPSDAPSIK